MPYKKKEHTKQYQLGFEAGSRVKGGHTSFEQLLDKYDRLRREYNKRILKAQLSQYLEDLKEEADNLLQLQNWLGIAIYKRPLSEDAVKIVNGLNKEINKKLTKINQEIKKIEELK